MVDKKIKMNWEGDNSINFYLFFFFSITRGENFRKLIFNELKNWRNMKKKKKKIKIIYIIFGSKESRYQVLIFFLSLYFYLCMMLHSTSRWINLFFLFFFFSFYCRCNGRKAYHFHGRRFHDRRVWVKSIPPPPPPLCTDIPVS